MFTRTSYAKFALVLGTLSAFGPLSVDMYLPGLPVIAREFGVSTAVVQHTLPVFFVGMALGQVLYGPISDRIGRRRPLLVGSALYAAACMGCALTTSIDALIALRLAQALGGCAGIVISRSVVRDLFDVRESARMFSFLMLVMGLAPITAPLIGGQLLLAFGWRAIFVVLAGFGLACFALVWFSLPETLPAERRSRSGLGESLRVYGRLFTNARFMGFALAGGLASSAMFAYIAGSPFVFIELNGVAPERFGLIFGANACGLIFASQINRGLLDRYPGERILSAAMIVMAASALALLLSAATGAGGFAAMLGLLFVCIASTGMIGPNTTAAALGPHGGRAGSASAVLGAAQSALAAASGALVSALHNGTALPMAGTIALCGALAFAVLHGVAFRAAPVQAAVEARGASAG